MESNSGDPGRDPKLADSRRSDVKTFLSLGLGMAAFGSATPVSRIVAGAMPVFVAATLRMGIGAVALSPLAWRSWGSVRSLSRGDWALIGVIALFGMFGFSTLMLYGMKSVSGVVGAVVMSTTPAVTAVASMLFFGDRPTWRKVAAIVLAVIGVLVLHLGRGSDTEDGEGVASSGVAVGSLLVFGAVCCEAVYTLVGKRVSERVDPGLVAFLASVVAIPLFIPLAIGQWDEFALTEVSASAWAAVAWYGAGTLALGTWLWYSGVRNASGAVAAGFMGVMPVSAFVLSYVLLGEEFRMLHLVGFVIVAAGVGLISWEHMRASGES